MELRVESRIWLEWLCSTYLSLQLSHVIPRIRYCFQRENSERSFLLSVELTFPNFLFLWSTTERNESNPNTRNILYTVFRNKLVTVTSRPPDPGKNSHHPKRLMLLTRLRLSLNYLDEYIVYIKLASITNLINFSTLYVPALRSLNQHLISIWTINSTIQSEWLFNHLQAADESLLELYFKMCDQRSFWCCFSVY